jgi:uncharacterized protein YjgD (DUF1641 family)
VSDADAGGARFANAPADEIGRLTQALREALTDNMVERLAVVAGTALEFLDRLGDARTGAAVNAALDRLVELHSVGALDTVFDLAMLAHAARSAATDGIVERLFDFVEQKLGTLDNAGLTGTAEDLVGALHEAAGEASRLAPRGGIIAALALLGKPETQKTLRFLLAFAGKLQKSALRR